MFTRTTLIVLLNFASSQATGQPIKQSLESTSKLLDIKSRIVLPKPLMNEDPPDRIMRCPYEYSFPKDTLRRTLSDDIAVSRLHPPEGIHVKALSADTP